jgi:hypothetical protein
MPVQSDCFYQADTDKEKTQPITTLPTPLNELYDLIFRKNMFVAPT